MSDKVIIIVGKDGDGEMVTERWWWRDGDGEIVRRGMDIVDMDTVDMDMVDMDMVDRRNATQPLPLLDTMDNWTWT